ncbi:DUF6801 domain-containing protein [Streptomyces sp. HMX112]|uniref:DUF6801 domain-containing protein n=1 Tax=Streptomyces sp. HMX112 TaxID=3390850 RepID=UPI003A80F250
MSGSRSSTPKGRRRLARTAAAGAAVLVAGLVPGTGVAVGEGEQHVARDLAYRCARPGGGGGAAAKGTAAGAAAVRVSAVLPRRVPVGRPVQPRQVSVRVRLPADAVADLTARGAATAGGALGLTAAVVQRGTSAEVAWSRLPVADTALPGRTAAGEGPAAPEGHAGPPPATTGPAGTVGPGGTGGPPGRSGTAGTAAPGGTAAPTATAAPEKPAGAPAAAAPPVTAGPSVTPAPGTTGGPAPDTYTVEAKGAVPAVTARSGGELSFSAGPLGLDLLPRTADGSPTTPPHLSLACAPVPGADTVFARVAVAPAPGASGAPATPPATPPATDGPGSPPGRPERPGRDPGCVEDPVQPSDPVPAHGYLTGYANVEKQRGAMLFEKHGLLRVNMLKGFQSLPCNPPDGPFFAIYSDSTFDLGGKPQMPPATATFLTFGFMPTSATVELALAGRLEIVTHVYPLDARGRQPQVTTATGRAWLRLRGVTVNGTPLDVGPACRTAEPMRLELTGRGHTDVEGRPHGYTVAGGGPLTADSATIPAFSGCGAREDLDALFTASLSGGGNRLRMTQGPLCAPGSEYCPDPPKPEPER